MHFVNSRTACLVVGLIGSRYPERPLRLRLPGEPDCGLLLFPASESSSVKLLRNLTFESREIFFTMRCLPQMAEIPPPVMDWKSVMPRNSIFSCLALSTIAGPADARFEIRRCRNLKRSVHYVFATIRLTTLRFTRWLTCHVLSVTTA